MQRKPIVALIGMGLLGLTTPQGAQAQEGAAYDHAFPVVGGPVGTPYPYAAGPGDVGYDIARDPMDVPPEPLADGATVTIKAYEFDTYLSPADNNAFWAGDGSDVKFHYYAFGGGHAGQDQNPRVPGPFIRVREGREVTIEFDNTLGTATHNIDFHAVVGLKGGAAALDAGPGETSSFTFVPENPGLYVYHCVGEANPFGIASHMNNGMYGLILVEPAPPRGHHRSGYGWGGQGGSFNAKTHGATEMYVFQGDIYRDEATGGFDEQQMLTILPDYSVYNGRVGALIDHPLIAQSGTDAVIYHGAAGGHIPGFHIIGEIFDEVWFQGDILSTTQKNLQTVLIPPAGSGAVLMDGDELVPTDLATGDLNVLVDHASPYFRMGAVGIMVVDP